MDELNPAAPSPERWQQLIGELSFLFSASVHRGAQLDQSLRENVLAQAQNEELEKRVKELEREVQVWRQAHKHEVAAKEALVADARDPKNVKDDSSLIVCLIDGNSTVFASSYLQRGKLGGEAAALALHRQLAPHGVQSAAMTVCTSVFCHRARLRDTLVRSGVCSGPQFDMFWTGFVQAAPMFYMVDVGSGKEAADSKMREALRVYARMPQVLRVFFGGAHDGGYRPPLAALALEGYLDKVVLVQAHDEIAPDLRSMDITTVKWPGLFLPHKLSLPAGTAGNDQTAPPPGPITNAAFSPTGSSSNPDRRQTPKTPGGKRKDSNGRRNVTRTVPLPSVPLPT